MSRQSAGILLYRRIGNSIEVFLVHPGGPFFVKKDLGAWTIPKGEPSTDEELLHAARREFLEETGVSIDGDFLELTPVKQKGGKTVHAFAVEGNVDPETIRSNSFEIEWPPRSGKKRAFAEIDRAGFFDTKTARQKINRAQVALLEELDRRLSQQG